MATLTSSGETQRLLASASDDIQASDGKTNEMEMQQIVKQAAQPQEAEEVHTSRVFSSLTDWCRMILFPLLTTSISSLF
jgi:hypothetical protein